MRRRKQNLTHEISPLRPCMNTIDPASPLQPLLNVRFFKITFSYTKPFFRKKEEPTRNYTQFDEIVTLPSQGEPLRGILYCYCILLTNIPYCFTGHLYIFYIMFMVLTILFGRKMVY